MYDQMSKKTPVTFIIIYMCDIKLITIMIMIMMIIIIEFGSTTVFQAFMG